MSEITASDVCEYLETQDDFDLELFVNRTLLEKGLYSQHGGTYIDPYTGKTRQFDIRASAIFLNIGWELHLAIECKSLSTEFPLVVSRVPRPLTESGHYLIRSWEDGDPDVRLSIFEAIGSRLLLYPDGRPVGKRTFQLRREPSPKNSVKTADSESYEKWSQALASAADLVERGCSASLRHSRRQFFAMVLPILVISDETLWAVDYDEKGRRSTEPRRVDECELFVDREYDVTDGSKYPITHLHVYTRKGFVKFVESIKAPNSMKLERIFGATAPFLRQT